VTNPDDAEHLDRHSARAIVETIAEGGSNGSAQKADAQVQWEEVDSEVYEAGRTV
jgi:hypothetical protein